MNDAKNKMKYKRQFMEWKRRMSHQFADGKKEGIAEGAQLKAVDGAITKGELQSSPFVIDSSILFTKDSPQYSQSMSLACFLSSGITVSCICCKAFSR